MSVVAVVAAIVIVIEIARSAIPIGQLASLQHTLSSHEAQSFDF